MLYKIKFCLYMFFYIFNIWCIFMLKTLAKKDRSELKKNDYQNDLTLIRRT